MYTVTSGTIVTGYRMNLKQTHHSTTTLNSLFATTSFISCRFRIYLTHSSHTYPKGNNVVLLLLTTLSPHTHTHYRKMSTNEFIDCVSTIGSVVSLDSVIPTKRVAVSGPLIPTSPTIARSGVRLSMNEVNTRSLLMKSHYRSLALAPSRPFRQLRRGNRLHRHLDEVGEARREVHACENLVNLGFSS